MRIYLKAMLEEPSCQSEPSDDELMERIKQKDKTSFSNLIGRYEMRILNFAYQLTGDRPLAEDLAQEIFLRLYQMAPSYNPKGKFLPYLFAMARHVIIDFLRKRGSELRHQKELGQTMKDLTEKSSRGEIQELIHLGLQKLPEKFRTPLVLCELQNFSYKEAAEIIGTSVKTLSSRLSRAKIYFKRNLAPYLKKEYEGL
jgi:RNA polymerase sigma-70 factor (ECF subfamily)